VKCPITGASKDKQSLPTILLKKRTIFSKTEDEETKSTVNTKINIEFWV